MRKERETVGNILLTIITSWRRFERKELSKDKGNINLKRRKTEIADLNNGRLRRENLCIE